MAEHSQAGGAADAFNSQLDALEKQVETVRDALRGFGRDIEAGNLRSTHEELRVIDEEIRAQRIELARLLDSVRARRWQHERLIQVLPVAVVVTEPDGRICSGNAATAVLLHLDLDSLPGRPLVSFVRPEDRSELHHLLASAVREQASFRQVTTLLPPGGDAVRVELAASVSYDAVTGVTEVTWVLLRDDGGTGLGPPAVLRPAVASALVELGKVPLRRLGRAANVSRMAALCAQALGPGYELSVTIGTPREPEIVATSSKLAQLIDGAQMIALEGPGLDAWTGRQVVQTADLRERGTWRRFVELTAGTGIRSVLALPIATGDEQVGVLSIFSTELNGFGGGQRDVAELLVSAMAAVLHEIDLKEQLEATARTLSQALESRATIEQAKGVLMAQTGVDADEAFARLVKMSRDSNVKLRVLAARIVKGVAAPRREGQDGGAGAP